MAASPERIELGTHEVAPHAGRAWIGGSPDGYHQACKSQGEHAYTSFHQGYSPSERALFQQSRPLNFQKPLILENPQAAGKGFRGHAKLGRQGFFGNR